MDGCFETLGNILKTLGCLLVVIGVIWVLVALITQIGTGTVDTATKVSSYTSTRDDYREGHCLILESTLVEVPSDAGADSSSSPSYSVSFRYKVLVSGIRNPIGYRYDWFQDDWQGQSEADAERIANQYSTDAYTSCWYDPLHPAQAVLVRDLPPSQVAFANGFTGTATIIGGTIPCFLLFWLFNKLTTMPDSWVKRKEPERLSELHKLGKVQSLHSRTLDVGCSRALGSLGAYAASFVCVYFWSFQIADALWSPDPNRPTLVYCEIYLAILVIVYTLGVVSWRTGPLLRFDRICLFDNGLVRVDDKYPETITVLRWEQIKKIEKVETEGDEGGLILQHYTLSTTDYGIVIIDKTYSKVEQLVTAIAKKVGCSL